MEHCAEVMKRCEPWSSESGDDDDDSEEEETCKWQSTTDASEDEVHFPRRLPPDERESIRKLRRLRRIFLSHFDKASASPTSRPCSPLERSPSNRRASDVAAASSVIQRQNESPMRHNSTSSTRASGFPTQPYEDKPKARQQDDQFLQLSIEKPLQLLCDQILQVAMESETSLAKSLVNQVVSDLSLRRLQQENLLAAQIRAVEQDFTQRMQQLSQEFHAKANLLEQEKRSAIQRHKQQSERALAEALEQLKRVSLDAIVTKRTPSYRTSLSCSPTCRDDEIGLQAASSSFDKQRRQLLRLEAMLSTFPKESIQMAEKQMQRDKERRRATAVLMSPHSSRKSSLSPRKRVTIVEELHLDGEVPSNVERLRSPSQSPVHSERFSQRMSQTGSFNSLPRSSLRSLLKSPGSDKQQQSHQSPSHSEKLSQHLAHAGSFNTLPRSSLRSPLSKTQQQSRHGQSQSPSRSVKRSASRSSQMSSRASSAFSLGSSSPQSRAAEERHSQRSSVLRSSSRLSLAATDRSDRMSRTASLRPASPAAPPPSPVSGPPKSLMSRLLSSSAFDEDKDLATLRRSLSQTQLK